MFVYKITNNINNKVYIGITKNINERFNYHRTRAFQATHKEYNKPLYQAFRKYGIENFNFEIVFKDLTLEEAKNKEIELIAYYHSTTHANGYNITLGGDYTGVCGEEHHNAILTEKEALDIHQRRLKGEQKSKVFDLYKDKISWSGFSNVWQLRTWKHLDPEYNNRDKCVSGVKNVNSIFNEEQVREIRLRKKRGDRRIDVFNEWQFFCSEAAFNRIWYYKTYKDIIV